MLEKGADIDSRDNNGRTPLSWALLNENTSPRAKHVITLLRKEGGDI